LGERLLCKQEGVGSIPITSTGHLHWAPPLGAALGGGSRDARFLLIEFVKRELWRPAAGLWLRRGLRLRAPRGGGPEGVLPLCAAVFLSGSSAR
jgi:hypothetical protein